MDQTPDFADILIVVPGYFPTTGAQGKIDSLLSASGLALPPTKLPPKTLPALESPRKGQIMGIGITRLFFGVFVFACTWAQDAMCAKDTKDTKGDSPIFAKGDPATAAQPAVERVLKEVERTVAAGPYQANWASLEKQQVPEWYLDGKFGIFVHWGVYSVPAFEDEWYPRKMYDQKEAAFKHHVATYGPQSKFGYKDFIPMFKGEKFDPDHWAELFKKAGAKFVMPVAEHHDGFVMYDSDLTDWCATKMGPRRDVIGDLAKAIRKQGLILGLSSHRAENWFYFEGGMKFDSDVQDPRYRGLYGPGKKRGSNPDDKEFVDDWLARACEMVDKYQPQLVWFDWCINQQPIRDRLPTFAAFYYNRGAQRGQGVAINYKAGAFPDKAAVFDVERGQLGEIRPLFWQTDTAVSKNSWGYVKNQDYKTATTLVGDLIDVVSKNGALLLNIGPRADGTIPEAEEELLLEIGRWLTLNGEAIYGSRPWSIYGEGPTKAAVGAYSDKKQVPFTGEDIRFTTKGDVLYAIALAWPGQQLVVKSLAKTSPHVDGQISDVQLLGHEGKLEWSQTAQGLTVELPKQKPCKHAFVFKISGLKTAATKDASKKDE